MIRRSKRIKADIAILNRVLYGTIVRIKDTVVRVRVTLAVMDALAELENEALHRAESRWRPVPRFCSPSRSRGPLRLPLIPQLPCHKEVPRSYGPRVDLHSRKGNPPPAKGQVPISHLKSGRNQEFDNPVAGNVSASSRAPAKAVNARGEVEKV